MTISTRSYPKVATREDWRAARIELLAREKEATRLRDRVNASRRRLPMVKIEKDYLFEGPAGALQLVDMFEGRHQLYVHHFMWNEARDSFCPFCSSAAELTFTESLRALLHERDATLVCVSRAPYSSIARYKAERGWTFPWYSSFRNDFNYDYHVTLDADRHSVEYNYADATALLRAGVKEASGASVFLRRDRSVYHAYSTYARGLDHLAPGYGLLDLTPYGRQEDWEDSPPGWPQRPTYG